MPTAAFANSTEDGQARWIRCCGRCMCPGKGCLWIGRARQCPSTTPATARRRRPICSWRGLGAATKTSWGLFPTNKFPPGYPGHSAPMRVFGGGPSYPFPQRPFELATWSKATANIDYHVVVENHYYSVPYQLIHEELHVRATDSTVELFHQHKRVAAHPRSSVRGAFSTLEEHRPKAHQKYLEWTPSRIGQWAGKTGPNCARLGEPVMASGPHPDQV